MSIFQGLFPSVGRFLNLLDFESVAELPAVHYKNTNYSVSAYKSSPILHIHLIFEGYLQEVFCSQVNKQKIKRTLLNLIFRRCKYMTGNRNTVYFYPHEMTW